MRLPPGLPVPDLNQLFQDLAGGRISASRQPRTIQTECLFDRSIKPNEISGRAATKTRRPQPIYDLPKDEHHGERFSSADDMVNEKLSLDKMTTPHNLENGSVALYSSDSASPNHGKSRGITSQETHELM
ncbi:hypothetical protein AB5N19_10225 [Seiridium cardinale]